MRIWVYSDQKGWWLVFGIQLGTYDKSEMNV